MSGHSKWSKIKRKKGAADAQRGRIFTRIIKELTVAARMGGGDPEGNPRLRTAISNAKSSNMPHDNIERAIKKGTGELEGVSYEETSFEGYGPNGVAMMVEVVTDNRNRTVAEIRSIFSKGNGNLGETGCVSWMFKKKGIIVFESGSVDEETLMEVALEAGAEDIKEEEDGGFEVVTPFEEFYAVKDALDAGDLEYASAEIVMIPETTVKCVGKHAEQVLRLIEKLEDCDDVQNVWANFDIDEAELESLSA